MNVREIEFVEGPWDGAVLQFAADKPLAPTYHVALLDRVRVSEEPSATAPASRVGVYRLAPYPSQAMRQELVYLWAGE